MTALLIVIAIPFVLGLIHGARAEVHKHREAEARRARYAARPPSRRRRE